MDHELAFQSSQNGQLRTWIAFAVKLSPAPLPGVLLSLFSQHVVKDLDAPGVKPLPKGGPVVEHIAVTAGMEPGELGKRGDGWKRRNSIVLVMERGNGQLPGTGVVSGSSRRLLHSCVLMLLPPLFMRQVALMGGINQIVEGPVLRHCFPHPGLARGRGSSYGPANGSSRNAEQVADLGNRRPLRRSLRRSFLVKEHAIGHERLSPSEK